MKGRGSKQACGRCKRALRDCLIRLRARMPQAASEDELRVSLGLLNYTTGKGKVALTDTNMRPIEVFMCSVVRCPPKKHVLLPCPFGTAPCMHAFCAHCIAAGP
jgi:hypothetical protein